MAQQLLNIGTIANDETGDTALDGAVKINENFDELYDTTILTSTNQASLFPNSRQLLAGTGLTFDDTVAGERTLNVDNVTAITESAGTYAASSPDFSSYNVTVGYVKTGRFVNIRITAGDTAKGTGLADPGTLQFRLSGTNMPALIRPSTNTPGIPLPSLVQNGSVLPMVSAVVQTDGTITFRKTGPTSGSAWFNGDGVGVNGMLSSRISFTYILP